jgi:protein LTV1
LDAKTGIPRGILGSSKRERNTADQSSSSEEDSSDDGASDILSLISSLSVARPKNETPEERKLRKQTLKSLRKERRIEKKTSRSAFKDEKIRQEKEVANVQRRLKTISML